MKFFDFSIHVFLTSFVNIFFQNIYTFVIGLKYTLGDLGYYTQADKWSKMGVNSVSQTIGYSVFPALSSVQDDKVEKEMRTMSKADKIF